MRKLNCSRRSLRRSSPRSLSAFARKSFAFMVVPSRSNLAFNESRGHRNLRVRKPACIASGHAAAIGGVEAVFAERDKIAELCAAGDLALELFAEFSPLRLHHVSLPCVQPAAGAAAVVGAVAAASISASGASASG